MALGNRYQCRECGAFVRDIRPPGSCPMCGSNRWIKVAENVRID